MKKKCREEHEEEEQDDEEETKEDEHEHDLQASKNNSTNQDAAAVLPAEFAANEHLGDLPDFLLNYDDTIGGMCCVYTRTPEQTKDFKRRLHEVIPIVDAQLCKPPPGKVCVHNCKKLRAKICMRTIPCSRPTCSAWHAVKVRILHYQSSHCELKLRVYLRETVHMIGHVKLRIQELQAKLQAKQREFDIIQPSELNPNCECERLLEATLVRNDITEIESEITNAKEKLEPLEDFVSESWKLLNEVGIYTKDDEADGFPDLNSHYVSRRKRKAAQRKDVASVYAVDAESAQTELQRRVRSVNRE